MKCVFHYFYFYMDFQINSSGLTFSQFLPKVKTPFERLFEIFKELITHTSGDFDEAIDWMRELNKEYKFADSDYTIDDFIEDLLRKAYIQTSDSGGLDGQGITLTPKTEKLLRQHALNQVFGRLKKSSSGNHATKSNGPSGESSGEFKAYKFGDSVEKISITESIRNAQIRTAGSEFNLTQEDLVVHESVYNTQMSTVLMIDISHSMILYGEDRITPAKKVAMALAEFINTQHPKDSLDILVFGNDAWSIKIKDIPYLNVGPYHTNTVAGLSLAMDLLRRRKNSNKQIFMITDGKPSCLKNSDGTYYKNSNGLDKMIVEKCYNMARQARRLDIAITTFMIAQDPYLRQFIEKFSEACNGNAIYTGLKGLGDKIFKGYEQNKKKD